MRGGAQPYHSFDGHTKILHSLVGMGSAALAAFVSLIFHIRRQNFMQWTMKY